mmetsp:Transcript_5755/g.13758  ORF Transcript_5755/g.13758 Transcript_5755/m.13758 type:complete len:219 (+) Transcript_5755:81-737(+)
MDSTNNTLANVSTATSQFTYRLLVTGCAFRSAASRLRFCRWISERRACSGSTAVSTGTAAPGPSLSSSSSDLSSSFSSFSSSEFCTPMALSRSLALTLPFLKRLSKRASLAKSSSSSSISSLSALAFAPSAASARVARCFACALAFRSPLRFTRRALRSATLSCCGMSAAAAAASSRRVCLSASCSSRRFSLLLSEYLIESRSTSAVPSLSMRPSTSC